MALAGVSCVDAGMRRGSLVSSMVYGEESDFNQATNSIKAKDRERKRAGVKGH